MRQHLACGCVCARASCRRAGWAARCVRGMGRMLTFEVVVVDEEVVVDLRGGGEPVTLQVLLWLYVLMSE